MEKTLRELVDELPTQALDLFVQHYEAGEVGGYAAIGVPRRLVPNGVRRCPCASLGFMAAFGNRGREGSHHPAHQIEWRAREKCLDTAELYSECLLAIQERDAALTPERAAVEV